MAIITVSGGIYSGGKELAECLSEKLGYRLVPQEHLLPLEASQLGAPDDEPETALSQKYGLLEGPSLQKILYTAYMQVAICEDARADGVVYHGQAAHLLLREIPHHLGVKIVADMEYRAKAAMKYRFLNYDKALEFIKSRDAERDKWVRALYNADRNDPSYYDIVIRAETLNMANACDLISKTVTNEIITTPESLQAVDDLILAAELRVKVALERNIVYDHIDIKVHDGVVTISGTVRWSVDSDKIRELVRHQPGVKGVESKMAVRW